MSFAIGIVGLPNVGKSTLFKALTKKHALIANYPFATIEPNVGIVPVPDKRLDELAKVSNSEKVVNTTIEFVDIAGLVKGASQGEGLGNKFLAHIREVDAIAQVVRDFTDPDIIHVHGTVDPKNDFEVIQVELALADMDTVERRLNETKSKLRAGSNTVLEQELALYERIKEALNLDQAVRDMDLNADELKLIKPLHLLTAKPMMLILNTDEGKASDKKEILNFKGPIVEISAKIEAELVDLSDEEAKEYLQSIGQSTTGLDKLILAGYKLLNLITFLTSGPMESRAWTVVSGTKAPQAAGVIHGDFEKGFIRAEVCNWQEFVSAGGWGKIKETGKMHLEGRDYVIKDGDLVYFHVNT